MYWSSDGEREDEGRRGEGAPPAASPSHTGPSAPVITLILLPLFYPHQNHPYGAFQRQTFQLTPFPADAAREREHRAGATQTQQGRAGNAKRTQIRSGLTIRGKARRRSPFSAGSAGRSGPCGRGLWWVTASASVLSRASLDRPPPSQGRPNHTPSQRSQLHRSHLWRHKMGGMGGFTFHFSFFAYLNCNLGFTVGGKGRFGCFLRWFSLNVLSSIYSPKYSQWRMKAHFTLHLGHMKIYLLFSRVILLNICVFWLIFTCNKYGLRT